MRRHFTTDETNVLKHTRVLSKSATNLTFLTYLVGRLDLTRFSKFAVDYVRLQLRMEYKGLHLAGSIGLEPIAYRLTAGCSTIELTTHKKQGVLVDCTRSTY